MAPVAPRQATQQIDALAGNSIEGYRAAPCSPAPRSQLRAGQSGARIATSPGDRRRHRAGQAYRDTALIRATPLEFDSLQPQEVIAPAAAGGEPATAPGPAAAGEMVGAAHLKMNRPDLAGPVFVRVARDENAPETMRQRASMMAASLGLIPILTPPVHRAGPSGRARARGDLRRTCPAPATREKAR